MDIKGRRIKQKAKKLLQIRGEGDYASNILAPLASEAIYLCIKFLIVEFILVEFDPGEFRSRLTSKPVAPPRLDLDFSLWA